MESLGTTVAAESQAQPDDPGQWRYRMQPYARSVASTLIFLGSLTTAAVHAQDAACLDPSPKLRLTPGQDVKSATPVEWLPDCRMVIETWRGNECRKTGLIDNKGRSATQSRPCKPVVEGSRDVGVGSGKVNIADVSGPEKGPLGIKLWVPNRNKWTEPVDVNVR